MKDNQQTMASTTSGSRKLKKNSLPKFEAGMYSNIPSGELIVFAVHYLEQRQVEITLEDVVSICFRLFPHKFGLKKYPRWPDSALVGRRWGEARRKRQIVENADTSYRLTVKGLRLIKKVEKGLGIAPKPAMKRQPKQTAVMVIKNSPVTTSKKKIDKPTQEVPLVIEKKKANAAQVKKATPASTPVKKKNLAGVKKVSPSPEIKNQRKKTQPVRQEKITSSATVKKKNLAGLKKVSPAPVKQTPVPEIKVQKKKTQPVQQEKIISSAPVKKKKLAGLKKVSPVPVKQTPAPEIKVQEKKTQPVQQEKIISSAPVKKANLAGAKKAQVITQKKKIQPAQEEKVTQLELIPVPIKRDDKKGTPDVLPIRPVKVQAPKKESKPVELVAVQLIKQPAPSLVSKEAKERAGKFTRMMEKSDAYVQYKKNGSKANINEFDFRSLLLCTMESSAETLARNVELFKGYAEIQHRQDLILFLIFCEEKFPHLLKPQSKSVRKTKK